MTVLLVVERSALNIEPSAYAGVSEPEPARPSSEGNASHSMQAARSGTVFSTTANRRPFRFTIWQRPDRWNGWWVVRPDGRHLKERLIG